MKAFDLIKHNQQIAVLCNNHLVDLDQEISDDQQCKPIDFNHPLGKDVYWHTSAHILAHAVLNLFPGTKLGVGPAVEEGFYYDFIPPQPFTPEDLENIEQEMKKIIEENIEIHRFEKTTRETIDLLNEQQQELKIELIENFQEPFSFYQQGNFCDLCRGPHLRSTGKVKAVKILSVAAAYWKGDEKNKSMQRIYGVSFPSPKELKSHLHMLEEAKKRDHRKLGKKLDIFGIYEEAGPGLIYWHKGGTVIRKEIENLWISEHRRRGYNFVTTPHIAKADLWKISGHLDYYKENMYLLEDGQYVLKPMNCPEHILIFKNEQKSYKDLPYKMAELGTVYRKERSGVLHGMLRVRGFTQDDAHIFCTYPQLQNEIIEVLELGLGWIKRFGYEKFQLDLSLRDPGQQEKYAGTEEDWLKAEQALASAMDEMNLEYRRMEGEAVFYGPKIDFQLQDAIGRTWQGTTCQVDFNLPRRFDLKYTGADGQDHYVIMIHRAIMGSVERFVGGLIEHYSGNFPFWLAPEQLRIIPITDNQHNFAEQLKNKLIDQEVRCTIDKRSEKVGYKIRDAETSRVPLMAIIGEREVESESVSLRVHQQGDQGTVNAETLVNMCKEKIEEGRKPL
ncbi:MAG: threonine--tRNA ligase [bacterium]